jgi:hypothetical protein
VHQPRLFIFLLLLLLYSIRYFLNSLHRLSFFSDSFPALDHPSPVSKNPHSPSLPSKLISNVDIHYKHELIFSKVQESETETAWFLSSPFRVDLLDEKESVRTPIRQAGESELRYEILSKFRSTNLSSF